MIARTKLIQSIGGFDEDFFLYGEEQDLALRVRRAGQEVGYIDEAVVIHIRAHSERLTPLAEILEKKVRAEYLFYGKHYDQKAIQRIIRANLIKAIWRIISLRLEMYLFPIKQTSRDKLVKYETVYRITREIYQKQYTKRLSA
jgi:GT2 family glycosyltransferase